MQFKQEGKNLEVALDERIDSSNAADVEREICAFVADHGIERIVLDASNLSYISSVGLRIVMKLLKQMERVSIVNVSPEVYDVFEMTGFAQMMEVRKALREVSVEGLEQIGSGANGRVFRLDDERIIKVYNPLTNTPEKIFREREVSRKTFVKGIPSAISFELVRVDDSYGIIYEMVDAKTLGQVINLHPERLEEYATRMANLLKQLHATEFDEGELPDARLSLYAWVDIAERSHMYPEDTIAKMRATVDAIPQGNTFVHGDFHPGNIMVTDEDELVLIDMGDASMGDPIVDLCGSCQIMLLMQRNPLAVRSYTGLDVQAMARVWDIFIRTYCGTDDDARIEAIEQRLRFHALIRTLAGVTFSKAVTDEERLRTVKEVNNVFLAGYDRMAAAQRRVRR